MKKILFLFIIFSVSCKQNKPEIEVEKKVTPPIEVKKTDVIKDSISDYINPKLGLFSFKFDIDTAYHKLNKIKIYSDGKLVQTIKTTNENNEIDLFHYEKRLKSGEYVDMNAIELIDWNFDGFKDISVFSRWGSSGCSYSIWIYSKSKKKFVYNNELSGRIGLEIDSVSKYIVFHVRIGTESEWWDTMQYVNNKLKYVKGLYRERWNDGTGRYWVKTTYEKKVRNHFVTKVDSFMIKDSIIRLTRPTFHIRYK